MKSENIGGAVSMAGSCLFLLGGDFNGLIVTLSFLAAEVILIRAGHTRFGYSIGCILFAIGDGIAVRSALANGNALFQWTLGVMALAWAVGSSRACFAWLGNKFAYPKWIQAADGIQFGVGIVVLALRIPAICAAMAGGNYFASIAVGLWVLSDILIGRLQDLLRNHSGK